jgi:hypothetical protein
MAKNAKEQTRSIKATAADRPLIPLKLQHPAAMAFLYLCLLIFFHSIIFDGKSYQSADTIASHSWETLLKDAKAEGIYPLWNPYIFCGMPGYASLTFSQLFTYIPNYNLTTWTWWAVQKCLGYILFFGQKVGVNLVLYLVFGIGVYLLVYDKLKSKPVALIVALMATYSARVTILIMIGHVTKIAVLAWFPYVLLLMEKLREKFNLLHAFLLAILIRLMIEPGHVQFIFYIYLALGTYFLFLFIRALIRKENWKGILLSGTTLAAATVIAFLMGADRHLSTLEYNPYSMRGSNAIIDKSPTSDKKTVEGGLDYDYATSWSFSPGEMMTFFVPSWYGFGDVPYQGSLSNNQQQMWNFYLGPQPQVDCPQYMGVIVIVLAIIGFIRYRKEPFVQFMGVAIAVSLLIAFGREFSLVYDLMYRYFPMFNKFRIPLLILMLVQFFMPILAGYGIISFMTDPKKNIIPVQEKRWKYTLGGLLAGILIALIGKGIIKEIYGMFFPLQEVGKILTRFFGQQNPAVVEILYDFIVSSVVTDILVGCALLLITFAAFYYYQKRKLKYTTLCGLLIIVVLFDLWRVAWKPSDPKDQKESLQSIPTPEYVKILQQDTTNYRVLTIRNGQPVYGDNSFAYWRISNAFGYHGAKMRIFQDMDDVAGMGNPLVWQLMNVKYLISNRDESNPALVQVYNDPNTKVYGVRFALPRVFFVNRYEVSDNLGMLRKIADRSFDPRDIAYVSEDIKTKIDPPLQGAEATLVHYGIQDLEVRTTATGNNILFLSEAYYPKGWKAFIDGNEVGILRLDYLFRGVIIPPGTHTLTMKFEPASFILGKTISLISNLLILGVLIVLGSIHFWKRIPVQCAGSPPRGNSSPS